MSYGINTCKSIDDSIDIMKIPHVTLLRNDCINIIQKYKKLKEEYFYFDFDDILEKLFEIFKNDKEFLNRLKLKYQFIMIYEYQDTNALQNKILFYLIENKPLNQQNIMVVGDECQSIYKFNGADNK